jgi:hypothetical protein
MYCAIQNHRFNGRQPGRADIYDDAEIQPRRQVGIPHSTSESLVPIGARPGEVPSPMHHKKQHVEFRCFPEMAVRPVRLRLGIQVLLLLLWGGSSRPVKAQVTFSTIPVRISSQGTLGSFWQANGARLRENFDGTTGFVELQNVSSTSLENSVFYGEYIDALGRTCFSLVFSQAKNRPNGEPVAAGGTLELRSTSIGLFPAAEPIEVRLFLVRQMRADGLTPSGKRGAPVRAPITIIASKSGDDVNVRLRSEESEGQGPILDLAFAKVTVNDRGTVDAVDVLNVASPRFESWVRDFVQRQLTFYPATTDGIPQLGSALVMIRVVLSEKGIENSHFSPRTSPLVESYLTGVKNNDVPPVTDIVFRRFTGEVNRAGPAERADQPPTATVVFEPMLVDSYWSMPAVSTVGDPSMPHGLKQELDVRTSD